MNFVVWKEQFSLIVLDCGLWKVCTEQSLNVAAANLKEKQRGNCADKIAGSMISSGYPEAQNINTRISQEEVYMISSGYM